MLSKALLAKGSTVLATALVAGGIAFLLTGDGAAVAGPAPAQAWIDDPLDGATVPPGPVAVIAHAYHPEGITEMILLVDGVELQTTVPQGAGAVLVSTEWSWVPEGEGIHVIEVVGHDAGGGEGLPGRVVVEVRPPVAPPEPTTTSTTPTTTSTTTTTTTTSPTTTTTSPTTTTAPATTTTTTPPCTPPSPILFNPPDGIAIPGPFPSITFEWATLLFFTTCAPSGYLVEIATDEEFTNVVASEHFAASATEWTPATTLWGCNTDYYWRVWSKRSDGSLAGMSVIWNFFVLCVT
jgi:hypothetical protein